MTTEDHVTGPKPRTYDFYVNDKKYETTQAALTGAQIKAMVKDFPAGYGLMLEGHGHEENRLIGDNEIVHLTKEGRAPRFIIVPPATYGC